MIVALSGLAFGDELDKQISPPPAVVEPPLLPGGVDSKRLKELLVGLGYEVTETKGTKGTTFLKFSLTTAGFTFHPTMCLSRNQMVIWINVPVGTYDRAVPAEVMEDLLKANTRLSPSLFKRSGKTMILSSLKVNSDVTPRTLKQMLDRLLRDMKETEGLWNEAKWPGEKDQIIID